MKNYLLVKIGLPLLIILALLVTMLPNSSPSHVNVASAESGSSASEESCIPCSLTKSETPLENVQVKELDGADLRKAVANALSNKDVKTMRNFLVDEGFTPQINKATGQKVTLTEEATTQDIVVLVIPFRGAGEDNFAQLVFATNGDEAKVGAGIILRTGPTTGVTQAYDVIGGKVIHSATITLNVDATVTVALYLEKQADGAITSSSPNAVEVSTSPASLLAMTNCELCQWICNVVISVGCGYSFSLLCGIACAALGPGFFACFPICVVVVCAACGSIGWGTCNALCKALGYCR